MAFKRYSRIDSVFVSLEGLQRIAGIEAGSQKSLQHYTTGTPALRCLAISEIIT